MKSTFEKNTKSHLSKTMFFDESVDIARYDTLKYPWIDNLTQKQIGFFWQPEEVDLSRDGKEFKQLTPNEKKIFTSNLKRQILLDSVQGRAPSLAFLPICSLPELETWIQTWTFFEIIHSKSYTHIIRNVYPNPSVVFDEMLDIKEIMDCAQDISKYYDELIDYNAAMTASEDWHTQYGYGKNCVYDHKKALWLCLNAVNALEGIRFYVSFACSWAFAELLKMEGNAKIIKFIARDENLHLAVTQKLLKQLPLDDPDFVKIRDECQDEVVAMFTSVVEQEKKWAEYLFEDGSMIGLNCPILCDYIEFIAHKRMAAIGIPSPYKNRANPLPWTQKWISGHNVRVAPQETTISSYTDGGVKMDVDISSISELSL